MNSAGKSALALILLGVLTSGLCMKYTVIVITSFQGTSSRVELRLVGENGKTTSHLLRPNGGRFQAYSKNIFYINDIDVGKINKLEVYLQFGYWYIKRIVITAERLYVFSPSQSLTSGWTTIGGTCAKGFKKGQSGLCEDIDECKNSKVRACYSSVATCINTIGSYQCTCPTGYRKGYFGSCYDIDECSFGKICDYKCVNTPGSYRCECRSGYKLEEGKCVDRDECKDGSNNCDSLSTKCFNYQGGFRCNCKPGYKYINYNRTHCEVNFCSRQTPDNITIYTPARCLKDNANRYGDVCNRSCIYGYELRQTSNGVYFNKIECGGDGRWKGWFSSNYCVGRKCPPLPFLENVRYDHSYYCGTEGGRYKDKPCRQYCKSGYQVIQADIRICQADGTWTGKPATCQRIWPDPYINCPDHIYVTLPIGKNTSSVGSKWKLPRSNYKNFTVSPASVSSHYQFPAGQTEVRWTVTNPDGESVSCVQHINIQDKESPKIVYCPSPDVYYPAYTNPPYHVNYETPEFSDNVGVVRIVKTYVKNVFNATGGFNQYFTAYDSAGNSVRCMFTVVIGGTKCTRWPEDRGLPGQWSYKDSNRKQRHVQRQCINVPRTTMSENHYDYLCDLATGKWTPNRADDCVDYKLINKTTNCESGYQKKYLYKFYYCYQCGLGTHLKDGKCVPCDAGTYQDKRGQDTCKKCPKGTSSLKGDFTCRGLCPAGTFSKDGMEPFCVLCSKGKYQDKLGQTSCTSCPVNKFTNHNLGSSSCTDVKPSNQNGNGLLEIISIVKPKKSNVGNDNRNDTLDCYIKDSNYNLVSIQWQIVNKHKIPVDFLGKPKFKEIRNNSGKLIGSRLIIENPSRHNARLKYTCVATNVNGETRKTVSVPYPEPTR